MEKAERKHSRSNSKKQRLGNEAIKSHCPTSRVDQSIMNKQKRKSRRPYGCKSIDCVEYDQHLNGINIQINPPSKAAVGILNQKIIDGICLGRGGENKQSKQFFEALGIFNSNKELFVKLLQDPNSVVKHINRSNRLPLDKIVVLKASLSTTHDSPERISLCSFLRSHSSLINNTGKVKPVNNLLFSRLKRKMKNAMRVGRKEQHCLSTDGKAIGIIPSTCKSDGEDSKASTCSHLGQCESNMYNGEKEGIRRHRKETLGRMIRYSENDMLPLYKSGVDIRAQLKNSSFTDSPTVCEKNSEHQKEKKDSIEMMRKEKVEAPPWAENKKGNDHNNQLQVFDMKFIISDDLFPKIKFDQDGLRPKGYLKNLHSCDGNRRAEHIICEASPEIDDYLMIDPSLSIETTNGGGEDENTEYYTRNSPSTFSVNSSSSDSSVVEKSEDSYAMNDGEIILQSDKIHVHEEHRRTAPIRSLTGITTDFPLHVDASVSEYVKELLQTSRSNDHELLFGNSTLLLDYLNEVLGEVHESYVSSSPWTSRCDKMAGPLDEKTSAFHEAIKLVRWHVQQQQPTASPQSWEDFAMRELMRFGTWLNSHLDNESIVIETVDRVFEDLISETISDHNLF